MSVCFVSKARGYGAEGEGQPGRWGSSSGLAEGAGGEILGGTDVYGQVPSGMVGGAICILMSGFVAAGEDLSDRPRGRGDASGS